MEKTMQTQDEKKLTPEELKAKQRNQKIIFFFLGITITFNIIKNMYGIFIATTILIGVILLMLNIKYPLIFDNAFNKIKKAKGRWSK